MNRLSASGVKDAFGTTVLGERVYYLETVASTQDVARRMAEENAPEGTLVAAGVQEKGRGRGGRSWHSPRGGVWASVVLRPRGDIPVNLVVLSGALAAAKAVRKASGLPAVIKWPNDCVVEGRKIAGILGETCGDALVVGFGINVNLKPGDFPGGLSGRAASIFSETGVESDETLVLGETLRVFEDCYLKINRGGASEVLWEIKCLSSVLGKPVSVEWRGREHSGMAVDIEADGSIILRLDSGLLMKFQQGNLKCSLP